MNMSDYLDSFEGKQLSDFEKEKEKNVYLLNLKKKDEERNMLWLSSGIAKLEERIVPKDRESIMKSIALEEGQLEATFIKLLEEKKDEEGKKMILEFYFKEKERNENAIKNKILEVVGYETTLKEQESNYAEASEKHEKICKEIREILPEWVTVEDLA